MIILYSAVLMGNSHSIRNKFYVIKGTAFRRQACFPFFPLSVEGLNPEVISYVGGT